ncbi:RNA polymerase sigma factor [Sphingobacterium corticibacter]|uniref:RNA polymerase sigma-70 factor n=1 Tax=Sphingobacterium corticibacter TaxID=2171749 RepID=A0A2T8HFZ6_9SPHI|nr:sigma-70 family RNA polymerase sigma factor [Sphingobacterium corticibacter]PVH24320.1 hypothetical protein DC487_14645 [Sphingobacterium corticibacter]
MLEHYLCAVSQTTPMEESTYITRFRDGDPMAFTYFFDSYWEQLYTIAYRHLQDEDTAKDIVQELFIHLWERRTLISTDYPTLGPYLFKALKNKILNYYALEKVRKQVLDQAIQRMDTFTRSGGSTMQHYMQLEEIVDSAVAKLPKLVQAVYLMRLDDCSISQIAQTLNIAEQTVKNYLSDAKRILEKDITKRFADHDVILFFLTNSFLLHNYLT